MAKQALRVASGSVALLLFVRLALELLLKQSPDAKLVATLVVGLFAAVFLAGYGEEIAGRIKKIGPLELLEIQSATVNLEEVPLGDFDLKDLGAPGSRVKAVLTPEQEFCYQEADRLVAVVAISRSEPKDDHQRRDFFEMLYLIGRTAHARLEWLTAIKRLEYLEKVSQAAYRVEQVSNLIALSNLFYALPLDAANEKRTEKLEKARERLTSLAGIRRLDYLGYFWLAYAQDELGFWYEAARSNEQALRRRPRFAPALYNLSISLLKLEKPRAARRRLAGIRTDDEQFGTVQQGGLDEEMKTLVEKVRDVSLQETIRGELRRLGLEQP